MKLKGLVLVSLGACSYGILSTLVVLAYQAGFSLNDVIGSQTVLGAALLWLFVLIGSAIRRKSLSWPSKKQSILMLLTGDNNRINWAIVLRIIAVFISCFRCCAISAIYLDGGGR
ncbi:hypothetical protein ACK43P_004145 [Providencia stuartii]